MERALGTTVFLAGMLLWLSERGAVAMLGLEHAVGLAALLILVQGLIRDLSVIARRKRDRPEARQLDSPKIGWEINLCLESTVGSALLVAAALLWFAPGAGIRVSAPRGLMVAAAGLTLVCGWLTRDWVLTLRHVRDHYDLPVWRRGPPA